MHNDLTFFNNEPGYSLLDRFKRTLIDARFFDVLVGYFRTSGFYKLCDSFDSIEKARILVGINTDNKTVDIIKKATQKKFDLESHSKTKELFSQNLTEEVYQSEDKYEVEHGIKKFIEFIQTGKIELKAYPSKNIHAKVYITRYKENDKLYGSVITGSSNFSESGLIDNYEFNVELKNSYDVDYALGKFEKLWNEAVDISDTYIETVNENTWLNDQITPYELYLKFLYEYLKEDINAEDDLKTYLPDGYMELKYQKQAVITIKKILDQYNGAFIADVVGLGKTYISAMFAQSLPGKKLVICPPPIKDSWEDAFRDFGVRNFEIESLGKLDKIIRRGADRFDYVFVDEAHRFRNEGTTSYQMLHEICQNKKVILISATPLNNSVYDFFGLIKLFQKTTNSDIPGMPNIKGFFDNAKYKLAQYEKSAPEYLEEVKRTSKQVRDKILKYLMVRRTRTDVIKYFKKDIEQQGLFFPEVKNPNRIVYKFDDKTNITFNRTIALIKSLTYARYTPTLYIESEQIQLSDFEKQQDRNMAGFMKSRLVKRLESSRFAFEKTIERFIASYEKFIAMYNKGTVYISKKIDVYEFIDNDNEEALEAKLSEEETDKRNIIRTSEFNDKFLPDLMTDLQMLKEIKRAWSVIEGDSKIETFINELKKDLILNNNKIIIFTESKETGDYLFDNLQKDFYNEVFFYSSNCGRYKETTHGSELARDIIKENFDPKNRNSKDNIRILITTDVLAEGINLHKSNVIINYDLPWNPTRVLQRVGRVNRVGTKHEQIYIYNFFPTAEADEHLGLENNIKAKIQAFHETLGEDAKYLSEDEEITNHKLFGEELYNKWNNKCTYEECAEEENIELKYLEIIRNIRDNDEKLFEKIKKLPKKARSCRNLKSLDKKRLVTFFRKGKLKKFYITDGAFAEELAFDQAVKFFECEENTPKKTIPKEFYDYLDSNKATFLNPAIEEVIEVKQKGGRSNDKYIINRIEIALKDKGKLVDIQEEFLKQALKVFEDGIIPKKISKVIKDEIETELDSRKVYNSLKTNIPESYLQNNAPKRIIGDETNEIILSEFLLAGDN